MTPRADGRSPFVVAWSASGQPMAWLVRARSVSDAEQLVRRRRARRAVTARAATPQDLERLEWLFPSDRQAARDE